MTHETNPDVWPALPEPEYLVHPHGYTADQMRDAQKQMVRECWRVLEDCQRHNSARVLEERFGPFDE